MKASQIAEFLGEELVGHDIEVTGVCSITNQRDNCMAFFNKHYAYTDRVVLVLVDRKAETDCVAYIRCDTPRLSHALVTNKFFAKEPYNTITNVQYGENFKTKDGTVIGTAGFGFERLSDGTPVRRPQLGGVLIGNNVELGANNTIDRATFDMTIIGNNVKTDNGVHIGHNCIIGDNTLIAAGVQISGSVKIGKNCWLGTNCTIKNHITIGDNVTIGVGSVVTKSIPSNETWAGNPARKFK